MIKFRQKEYSLISRGVRFFKELSRIDPLPMTLEEYPIFLFHISKVKKLYPNAELSISLQEEISDRVNKFYKNPKAADTLRRIGQGFVWKWYDADSLLKFLPDLNNSSEALLDSWKRMQKIPKRYITDYVGVGGTGIVFDYGKDKVEKISFNGFSPNEMKFYSYLKKNPLRIFPKIYDLEPDQVILEKLDTTNPKLKIWADWIHTYTDSGRPEFIIDKKVYWDKIDTELGPNHEFTKFIKEAYSGIKKIFGKDTIGDISKSNIAIRPSTGEVVYFDPIGGLLKYE